MARRYTLDGRLGALIVRGAGLTADVAEAVTRATLDLSSTEVTQLDLTIRDPDLKLLAARLFEPGTPTTAGSSVDYGALKLEVRRLSVEAGPSLAIVARDLGAYKLKRARGPLLRRNLSPTQSAALDAKAAGLKFVGEASAKRPTVAREADESAWDATGRHADELGFLRFVTAGVLYFGRPTFLIKRAGVTTSATWSRTDGGARTDGRLRDVPKCSRSGDEVGRVASVEVEFLGELGDRILPGGKLALRGVPTFEGDYFVDKATVELDDTSPVRVSASTAVNPKPQPPEPPTAPAGSASSTAGAAGTMALGRGRLGTTASSTPDAGGQGTAEAFVKYALEQAGDRYTFGAEASASDADPDAFDCSELVEWAASRAGVKFVDGSVNQIARAKAIPLEQGIRTRGAVLFRPGNPNHIAISLGNGRTIEAKGRKYGVLESSAAGRFTRAGLIPGLRYA